MKRPTWAIIVGVLAIVFGAFGIFVGAQKVATPFLLKMLLKETMSGLSQSKIPDRQTAPRMTGEIEKERKNHKFEPQQPLELKDEVANTNEKQFKFPERNKSWAVEKRSISMNTYVIMGAISIVVAGFYLLSGILLLMMKQIAIKVFYTAITISILWVVIQSMINFQTGGMLMAQIPSAVASIVIDLILIVIVFMGKKDSFGTQFKEI